MKFIRTVWHCWWNTFASAVAGRPETHLRRTQLDYVYYPESASEPHREKVKTSYSCTCGWAP
jgi:hypothetical protein